ncbi:hypothetical protein [Nocardia nova]|uniref:hypothetical protein n=1 Tax=Nocardia nova TaxID=37330 RepID=UPI000CEA3B9B|nr:hypothetical protein [Nocardia nova]PPJ31635.1 hypothetical protein C5E41_06925 [Nocardia nova]
MGQNEDVTLWKYLAGESQAGRLDLDPTVSRDCLKACEDQLHVYKECKAMLLQMSNVTGLGDFPAADELAKMLGAKAVGGEGDFDSAFDQHIQVLELIRDTIKHSVDRLVDHDQQSAGTIAGSENR